MWGDALFGGTCGAHDAPSEFSGQRNSEGRLELVIDYETAYRSLGYDRIAKLNTPADLFTPFGLTVRTEDIVTVAPFSSDIYEKLNPGWRQRIARQALEAARDEHLTSDDPPDPPVYALSSIGTNFRFSGPT